MQNQVARVLLVDDHVGIHDDFRKILEQSRSTQELDSLTALMLGDESRPMPSTTELKIDSAYQGREALKLVEKAIEGSRHYALAFVDMRMPPGWDGMETIEKIWEADPDLQIVICSAHPDCGWEEVVQRLDRPEQLLILRKPFDVVEVRQMCSALVTRWQLWRETQRRIAELEELSERLRQEIREVSQRGHP